MSNEESSERCYFKTWLTRRRGEIQGLSLEARTDRGREEEAPGRD